LLFNSGLLLLDSLAPSQNLVSNVQVVDLEFRSHIIFLKLRTSNPVVWKWDLFVRLADHSTEWCGMAEYGEIASN
jgi:hypothetical protein